ncbi:MAG: hypothetical protein QOJ07_3956 [Thermoleophilaceae bacterium]|nr:hypothetical protein [Thermoleophilaceae bacterium]
MTEAADSQGFGEGVRGLASKARPSELEPKLEEAMENQPLLPHLLSLKVVLIAAGIGAVVALLLALLVAPIAGGIGLLLTFFAAWLIGANRSYAKRRETRDANSSDADEDEDAG